MDWLLYQILRVLPWWAIAIKRGDEVVLVPQIDWWLGRYPGWIKLKD